VLNLTPDHLDRLAPMGATGAKRSTRFVNQAPPDVSVRRAGFQHRLRFPAKQGGVRFGQGPTRGFQSARDAPMAKASR